jgi:drug/metabolite transporter (DMT)-like permease
MSEMPEARAQTGRDTHTRTSFVLLIGLSVVWGLNWPIMKIALADFEPLTFRTLCIGAGAIGLLAGAALLGEAIGAQELIALVLVVCALATALIPQGFLAWQRSGR